VGIVLSNVAAWEHALSAGWEWTLVLEDDAVVRAIPPSPAARTATRRLMGSSRVPR
jgi:hypothetical protein